MRGGTPLGPALILIAIAALSLGCSEERPAAPPAEPTAATPQPRGARASAEAPGELDWAVIRAISAEWKKMKGASGRTGILAEKPRYSLFTEELVIRDFFQDREGGYFVDVGCAWPVHASNTYYLEKHLGWSGIGIDALADYVGAWGEERPRSCVPMEGGREDSRQPMYVWKKGWEARSSTPPPRRPVLRRAI